MNDETALLAAISEHPEEDTPRLVYADWLDEHDLPVRAEFIRLQCELDRRRRANEGWRSDLLIREAVILKNHAGDWFLLPCSVCNGDTANIVRSECNQCDDTGWYTVSPKRGFAECLSATVSECFEQEKCPMCRGSKQVPDQFGTGVFVCPECYEDDYFGYHVPSDWLLAAVERFSTLERCFLTDIQPDSPDSGKDLWSWYLHDVPELLFDVMTGWDDIGDGRKSWRSRDKAIDVCNRAVITIAKDELKKRSKQVSA